MADWVHSIYPISTEVRNYINRVSVEESYKKGTILMEVGEPCNSIYLIKKGAVRAYLKEGNQELTIWICAEGAMVTSIRGYFNREPVQEYIEVIEDADLIRANYEDVQRMYERFPETNIVGRKLLELYYQDAEERAIIARLPRAESKYTYFVSQKGDLINCIPLKYIASYLGMTVETLSRIRSKLSKSK